MTTAAFDLGIIKGASMAPALRGLPRRARKAVNAAASHGHEIAHFIHLTHTGAKPTGQAAGAAGTAAHVPQAVAAPPSPQAWTEFLEFNRRPLLDGNHAPAGANA